MDLGLKNKVVLITGGATGIGKAAALAFLREGCRVAICGRSRAKLDAAVADLKTHGFDILAAAADAASRQDLAAFAATVADTYGGIDIWLNNAGIYPQCTLLDMTEQEWDDLMRINLKSVFLGAQIAAGHLKARGGGVILNASSFAAIIPSAGSGAYAATKAAISSLTRTLAAELAPAGIRVIAYIPGLIRTDMTEFAVTARGQALIEQTALKRLGDPEDIADPVVFLASARASYITGVSVEISGGKFCVQNPMHSW